MNNRTSNCSALIPSGSDQLSPAALACVVYLLAVLVDTLQLSAISGWVSPT
ncbi:MAG: hypothetical protein PVF74_08280 [Anaerolineales bacterium]